MVDILHRIGVQRSSPDKVYDALTTIDGLSGWWATPVGGSRASSCTTAAPRGPSS
jgi:uncharacterized protein YndB with AHSA1/START domain